MNTVGLMIFVLTVIYNVNSFIIFKGDDIVTMWKTGAIYKFLMPENNHAEDPRRGIFGIYVANSLFEPQIKSKVGFNYSLVNYMPDMWMFYSESSFDYETQLRFYVFDLYVGSEFKTITIYIQNIDDEPPSLICPDNLEMIDTISYDIQTSPCECTITDPDGYLNQVTFNIPDSNGKFTMGFSENIPDVEQTAKVKIANTTILNAILNPLESFTVYAKAQELRVYLKSLGAEISEEKSPKGIEDDLHKIIGVCDACFKEGNETEIEMVLNDIVSIMVLIPLERLENIILAFCEKLTKAQGPKLGSVCLRALWLLFQSLDDRSPMRYPVYYHLIQIAKQTDSVKLVYQNIEHLKQQFANCPPSSDQLQKLYRLLHEVLLKSNQSEQAALVMIELLGTYTDKNASHAREDAIRCIVSALADPSTFLLDPLLALKPVSFLEGELIHDLLNIFVSENLEAYMKFYKEHKEFVTTQGLNHEQNMQKMRLLSFMQLAESNPEISFDVIEKELQIQPDEVESFIIEVLKTKLVRARMDQASRKVFVSSTMHRTFGRAQWQQLRDLLHHWKGNLSSIQEGMKTITAAQLEMMNQQ